MDITLRGQIITTFHRGTGRFKYSKEGRRALKLICRVLKAGRLPVEMAQVQAQEQQQIIAFTGQAGSGKDTAADILCREYGYTRLSFAAALKDAIAVIFGWPRASLEGATAESRAWREVPDAWWSARLGRTITPRSVLQVWGTDLARDMFHPDIWLAALERRILAATGPIVITDCRFENEAAAIRRLGGHVVHIERGSSATATATAHISEKPISRDPSDYILLNDSDLETYVRNVRDLLATCAK